MNVSVKDLITIDVENAVVSEAGVRLNISVALQYLNWWLQVSSLVSVLSKRLGRASVEEVKPIAAILGGLISMFTPVERSIGTFCLFDTC